jgi:hypothetical protein
VVAAAGDPPATETSQHTVIEGETQAPVDQAAVADSSGQTMEAPRPMPGGATGAPSSQVAMVLPPTPPSQAGLEPHGIPSWQKYAVHVPEPGGKPLIAVIIDDMGLDKKRAERVLQLPGPLTISFMSYAEDLDRQTAEARARGHELMMHVPMEPIGEGIDPGPGALLIHLSPEELHKRVTDDLGRFKGYVGINNHMGSKFTAYGPGMQIVMEELHRQGLLFVDSMTTDRSVGIETARQAGVPAVERNVFLDNDSDAASIRNQLVKLEDLARRKGSAIAIGHPRDATIAALAAWLPTLNQKGLALVPVTAVVRARMTVAASAVTH